MTYKDGKFILDDGHEVPAHEAYQIANQIDKLDLKETIEENLEDTKYDISQLSENAIDTLVSACRKALANDEDEISDIIWEIASGDWNNLIAESKGFDFSPGYYEWNLSYGDTILFSADDFSEIMESVKTYDEAKDICKEIIDSFLEKPESLENASYSLIVNHKEAIIDVMAESICNHYDITVSEKTAENKKVNNDFIK